MGHYENSENKNRTAKTELTKIANDKNRTDENRTGKNRTDQNRTETFSSIRAILRASKHKQKCISVSTGCILFSTPKCVLIRGCQSEYKRNWLTSWAIKHKESVWTESNSAVSLISLLRAVFVVEQTSLSLICFSASSKCAYWRVQRP